MLIFILITLLFLSAGACVLRLFFAMIQDGGALDVLFGWQKMLSRLYGSQSKFKNLLGKALGDCRQCTAFWFMPFWFLCYYAFCKLVLGYWVTDSLEKWYAIGIVNYIWLAVFWSIGGVSGFYFNNKVK